MPYVQCKTYKQRNECEKYTIKKNILIFFNEKIIKKTLHLKNKNVFNFQKQKEIPKAKRHIQEPKKNTKNKSTLNKNLLK